MCSDSQGVLHQQEEEGSTRGEEQVVLQEQDSSPSSGGIRDNQKVRYTRDDPSVQPRPQEFMIMQIIHVGYYLHNKIPLAVTSSPGR